MKINRIKLVLAFLALVVFCFLALGSLALIISIIVVFFVFLGLLLWLKDKGKKKSTSKTKEKFLLWLMLYLTLSWSVSCYRVYVGQDPGIKENSSGWQKLTTNQKETIKYLRRNISKGVQSVKYELRERGFLFKQVDFQIYAYGNPLKNNLKVTVMMIDDKNSSGENNLIINQTWKKCPRPGSLELHQIITNIIKEIIGRLVVSPHGIPI